jgi:hypothetical protein
MSKVIDVEQVMKNMLGEELKQEVFRGEEVVKEPLKLKSVFVNSLLHPKNEDEKTSGEQKCARFALANAIQGGGEVTIGNSDVAMITNLVNKINSALIEGQVYAMIADAENTE